MKRILWMLCFAPFLMATTCDPEEDHYPDSNPCTMEARAGLNVTVSLNGEPATNSDGISITARDGNYIEDLLPVSPTNPVFTGLYERQGNFIVTVRKTGYQDYVSNVITITGDRCHVMTRDLSVNLIPL